MCLKQKKIRFKARIKLNHNIDNCGVVKTYTTSLYGLSGRLITPAIPSKASLRELLPRRSALVLLSCRCVSWAFVLLEFLFYSHLFMLLGRSLMTIDSLESRTQIQLVNFLYRYSYSYNSFH